MNLKGRNTAVVGSLVVAGIALLVAQYLDYSMESDSRAPRPDPQDTGTATTAPDAADGLTPAASPAPVDAEPPTQVGGDAAPTRVANDASTDPRHARRLEVEAAIRAAREARERWTAERSAAATSGTTTPAADAGTDVAELSPDYIRARIGDLAPLLRECYDLALHEDPALEGKLVVEFVIGGEPEVGAIVEESRILDESTLRHPVLDECVRETMYTAEFEDPPTGGRVTVRYPFRMSRSSDEPPPR